MGLGLNGGPVSEAYLDFALHSINDTLEPTTQPEIGAAPVDDDEDD